MATLSKPPEHKHTIPAFSTAAGWSLFALKCLCDWRSCIPGTIVFWRAGGGGRGHKRLKFEIELTYLLCIQTENCFWSLKSNESKPPPLPHRCCCHASAAQGVFIVQGREWQQTSAEGRRYRRVDVAVCARHTRPTYRPYLQKPSSLVVIERVALF